MYEGYFESNGKVPVEIWKRPIKLRHMLPSMWKSACARLSKKVMLIDVDDVEEGVWLLGRLTGYNTVVRRTTRGYHFLFKRPPYWHGQGNHKMTYCGVTIDYKCGDVNSSQCIRKDGVDREIVLGENLTADALSYPPLWLLVGDSLKVEGQRNDTLFKMTSHWKRVGATDEEAEMCFTFVRNELLSGMDDDEFNHATRYWDDVSEEGATYKAFFNGKTFDVLGFSHAMFQRFDLCMKSDSRGTRYICDNRGVIVARDELARYVCEMFPPISSHNSDEVIKKMYTLSGYDKRDTPKTIVNFNGKLYDVEDNMKPYALKEDEIAPPCIPHDYVEVDKLTEDVNTFMNNLTRGRDDAVNMVLEYIGYCCQRRMHKKSCMFIGGGGDNGKSTFSDYVTAVFGGMPNVSKVALRAIGSSEKGVCIPVMASLINIDDDASLLYIRDSSAFKTAVAGGHITVRQLYKDDIYHEMTSKILLTANGSPRVGTSIDAKAVERRILRPTFDNHFTEANIDVSLLERIYSEENMSNFISVAVRRYMRIAKTTSFTMSEDAKVNRSETIIDENTTMEFVDGVLGGRDALIGRVQGEVYDEYEKWCRKAKYEALGKKMFLRTIRYNYSLITKTSNSKSTLEEG